jgi:hypothetical protein
MAEGGMIADQIEHALHRNLTAQGSVIDHHRDLLERANYRLAVELLAGFLPAKLGLARWAL